MRFNPIRRLNPIRGFHTSSVSGTLPLVAAIAVIAVLAFGFAFTAGFGPAAWVVLTLSGIATELFTRAVLTRRLRRTRRHHAAEVSVSA